MTLPARGRVLYDFVLHSGVQDILELGFAHGTSTCYMAAALHERGSGSIVTMDDQSARSRRPSIFELMERTGLGSFVHPVFADRSYTWELKKLIEAQSGTGPARPMFDFCFIDGAHTWDTDGLSFFLADKLMRPGSWMLFDDLHWTYAASPSLKDKPWVRALPEDERRTPQVMKVFALLVYQHPGYSKHRVESGWGWAYKLAMPGEPERFGDAMDRLYQLR